MRRGETTKPAACWFELIFIMSIPADNVTTNHEGWSVCIPAPCILCSDSVLLMDLEVTTEYESQS